MEVEPYLVVSSLSGVVAQRLVRKICTDCKEEYTPSEMEKNLFQKEVSKSKLYIEEKAVHNVKTLDIVVELRFMKC